MGEKKSQECKLGRNEVNSPPSKNRIQPENRKGCQNGREKQKEEAKKETASTSKIQTKRRSRPGRGAFVYRQKAKQRKQSQGTK